MDRVLYSKYNSLRRPEFRITTEIHEDENGKYVVKRPEGNAAEEQIAQILHNHDLLKNYYQKIKVLKVTETKQGLQFPFVEGKTLKNKLDQCQPEKDQIVPIVTELLDEILAVNEECNVPFQPTEEFQHMFGKPELPEMAAVVPANLDSLLDNFIENESGLCCIDYEWVVDFPVPKDFIRFRALVYLFKDLTKSLFDQLSMTEFLEWFGYSEQLQAVFHNMENHFQQFVHGESWKYIYFELYKKKIVTVPDLERSIRDKDVHIHNLEDINHKLDEMAKGEFQRRNELEIKYAEISNSFFWRLTSPVRKVYEKSKTLVRKNETVHMYASYFKNLVRNGPAAASQQKKTMLQAKKRRGLIITEEELAKQRSTSFEKPLRFSIIVPLFNTPIPFLKDMIRSVQNQTYADWELCLADGSDPDHAEVEKTCKGYAKSDSRIKYRKLEKNLGISGNTNECLTMAEGDYIALFDHDDFLHPSALFENRIAIDETGADMLYSDEESFAETPEKGHNPNYKPDFAPDTLRSYNYICHLTVFQKSLLEKLGEAFRSDFDGSQDYDLILRLSEKAERIVHIPKILYYWRSHAGSTASDISAKPYTMEAAKKALSEHLNRIGLKGTVVDSRIPSTYKINYEIEGTPLISIVIPNKDHIDDLDKCIRSIREKSTYTNWEIIVVENNSTDPETFRYYEQAQHDPRIHVVRWEREFNYSAINNYGAGFAKGDYLLLLNNDIEVITPNWMEEMLMFAQRKDVGAVGAMLYYPDDTIQHAGVILGIGGVAGHSHKYFRRGDYGYVSRLTIAQNLSGVTAACVLMRKEVWNQVGGLDEGFAVAFNDVDLCMRIRAAGFLIVWTPYAELYHYESKSRGQEDNPEKQMRFKSEIDRFQARWGDQLEKGDPYYNPNLTLVYEDFRIDAGRN